VSEILVEVDEEQAAKEARKAEAASNAGDTGRQFYTVLVLLLIALALFAATVIPSLRLNGRRTYANGLPGRRSPGLNGCLRELWRIRRGVEEYLTAHAALPVTLAEVFDGKAPRCPSCRKAYVYERLDETHYTASCPSAQRHAVASVSVNSGSAPTVRVHTPSLLEETP